MVFCGHPFLGISLKNIDWRENLSFVIAYNSETSTIKWNKLKKIMPISMAWALVYGVHSPFKHLSHTRTVHEKKIHLKFKPCINCNSLYTLYINLTMHQKFVHLYITEITNINETIYSSSTHIKEAFELLRLMTTVLAINGLSLI